MAASTRGDIRFVLFVVVAFAAACTKPNPNTCCTTEAQCAALGASELRPCDVGQACGTDFQCVAAECATSSECPSDRPICQNELCVGACTSNDDCADVAGRTTCASDGVCVGCTESSQCSGTTAICDPQDRACRGCERDDECGSGVCIEAEGTCADTSTLIYIRAFGTDTGTCTSAQPCLTLKYAAQQLGGTRRVIRIEGGMLSEQTATTQIYGEAVIDGTGTNVYAPPNIPWLSVELASLVTIEGITLMSGTPTEPAIRVAGTLRVDRGAVLKGDVRSDNGVIVFRNAVIDRAVYAMGGTLEVSDVEVNGTIEAMNTQASVTRSRFQGDAQLLALRGGSANVVNNLFVQEYELSDSVYIVGVTAGSRFEFNTVVNVSGIDSDGVALYCDRSLRAHNNLFAYRSTYPHAYTYTCETHYSVYDDVAASDATMGSNLVRVPVGTIFVDLAGGDFHLASGSAARGAADPAADVTSDLEGAPRPNPAGTPSDVGAYEAP